MDLSKTWWRPIPLTIILLSFPGLACETLLGENKTSPDPLSTVVVEQDSAVEVEVDESSLPTEPQITPEVIEPSEDVPEPTEPRPTETIALTPSIESEQVQPLGEMGKGRDNPFPATDLIQAPNWDIQVLDVLRGDEAWQMVVDAYEFNDPPPEGMEYLVVRIFARSTYEDNEPHEISFFDFNVTGARLIKYGTAFVVDPEPPLDAELLTGEETEGWVTFLVGSDEENLILIFDEWDNFDEGSERFIALDEGASVTTPSGLDKIQPNTIGVDRQNPAAVGDKAVTDRWEITVVEVVRGEEALRLILDADDFNEPPEEGFEYLLAKIQAKNINVNGEEEWLDSTNFTVVGDLDEEYDTPFFTAPAPEFDANSYPGAEFEGWISLQAAEDDSGLLLIFESFYDFSDDSERYFALE